jgi:hypothetical protein
MVVPVEDVLEMLISRIEAYQVVVPTRSKELALGHLEAALAFLTGPKDGDGTMADQVCPVIDLAQKRKERK